MTKDKWKKGLLSSGLALELEIMRFFNRKDELYTLQPDYSYERKHEGQIKEFSIDLVAEYRQEVERAANINFLIECKYRSTEKSWLFMPWISTDEMILDEAMCRPITCTDCFDEDSDSNSGNSSSHIYNFSKAFPQAFKAVEIHKFSGDVLEQGITRGAYQLIYAIPNYVYKGTMITI